MYLADYHVHSRVSPDASYPMAEMTRAAITNGIDEICFTDHVEPMEWGGLELREPYNWNDLLNPFKRAQEVAGDRVKVRLGIELGDAVYDLKHTEKLLADLPEVDFIIGSIHILSVVFDYQDLVYFKPENQTELHKGLADYLRLVKKLAEWGKFSVLGHLTLPLRYLREEHQIPATFDGFEKEIGEIFEILIANGCGIELNTNRGHLPLPDAKWLKMYRELGGEIITLGTDAHRPIDLGCAIRERQNLLKECGFTKFCTFEKMKPIWHEL